jgi:hypothetical protein
MSISISRVNPASVNAPFAPSCSTTSSVAVENADDDGNDDGGGGLDDAGAVSVERTYR